MRVSVSEVNYPALLRSGLLPPRLLRTLPVSASECIPSVGTGIPDFAGDFSSRAVRSEPLLSVDTRPQSTVRAFCCAWTPSEA